MRRIKEISLFCQAVGLGVERRSLRLPGSSILSGGGSRSGVKGPHDVKDEDPEKEHEPTDEDCILQSSKMPHPGI
jgi:hypothetical protein